MNALSAPVVLSLFIATVKILDFQMIALSGPCRSKHMASKKKKSPSTPSQVRYDQSRFTFQEAWERHTDIIVPRKLLPERNMVIYHTEFDEFKVELMRRHWDEELISIDEGNINVAIVKEFYANLYEPEDKSPKQVRVRGHLIKFDEDILNTFLKTPVIVEEGENLCAYSRFALLRPDPHELATKLCIPGRGFELNVDALIITLCKARGVQSDSRSLESLSPAINLAYIKKNCWNLDDPTVTFKGLRKAKGRRSEAPTTSAALETAAPSSSTAPTPPYSTPAQTPAIPAPFLFQLLALSLSGPLEFLFTTEMLYSMLQSLHRGQTIIMQSLQSLGLPSIMSMDEFGTQMAWPRAQPSPSGGGGASAAQELEPKEPVAVAKEPAEGEDELTPPEPFYYDTDVHIAQEEESSTYQMPEPSPAPAHEETLPSVPVLEPEPTIQDSSAAPVLDLNEDQPQEDQDI
ncbi:hypothetical protein HKD37_18G050851 [Glycine soja]